MNVFARAEVWRRPGLSKYASLASCSSRASRRARRLASRRSHLKRSRRISSTKSLSPESTPSLESLLSSLSGSQLMALVAAAYERLGVPDDAAFPPLCNLCSVRARSRPRRAPTATVTCLCRCRGPPPCPRPNATLPLPRGAMSGASDGALGSARSSGALPRCNCSRLRCRVARRRASVSRLSRPSFEPTNEPSARGGKDGASVRSASGRDGATTVFRKVLRLLAVAAGGTSSDLWPGSVSRRKGMLGDDAVAAPEDRL